MSTKLTQLLTEATQSLKVLYLERTAEWAKQEYAKYEIRVKWRDVDWCKYFGLEPRLVNAGLRSEFLSFPDKFYNKPESRIYYRMRDTAFREVRKGLDAFLAKSELAAIRHYEDSIKKLAHRIIKKGLNQDLIEVKDSSIGLNINTTITDGTLTVRAFTIFACGEINAPHYRYLVK